MNLMVPTEPIRVRPRFDAEGRLSADLTCVACGYNLRGLTADAECPECGAAVRRSVISASSFGDVNWARRVALGVDLGFAALGLAMLAVFLAIATLIVNDGNDTGRFVVLGVLSIPLGFSGVAVVLFTSPEPAAAPFEHRFCRRRLARCFGLAVVAIPMAVLASEAFRTLVGFAELSMLVWVFCLAGWIIFCGRYVAELADRMSDHELSTHALVLSWVGSGLVLLMLADVVFARLGDWSDDTAGTTMCTLFGLSVLCGIWTLVVMLWLRVALSRAIWVKFR